MFTSNFRACVLVVGIGLGIASLWLFPLAAADRTGVYDIGQPATDMEIQAWDIDVLPNGKGLPPGQGTVGRGATVYVAKCASCHGPTGTEGPMNQLVGGQGTLTTKHPMKTVGSYWPYATTLYAYINRAMPFTAPQSLTSDEVYSVIAWILHRNGIVPDDTVIDAKTLPLIHMPNQEGFVSDPRPDLPDPSINSGRTDFGKECLTCDASLTPPKLRLIP